MELDYKKVLHNEVESDYKTYQHDERVKANIKKARQNDMGRTYMSVVDHNRRRMEIEGGRNRRKDLLVANNLKREFDAQCRLT